MKRLVVLAAVLYLGSSASLTFAQDFQARFLFHPQVVIKGNFGISGWFILPDVDDDKGERFRHLQVAGLMYRDRSRWAEAMYGFVDYQTKQSERLLNIRVSERSLKPFSIFVDFHSYKNRKLLGFFIDRPVIGKFRAGLESDNWFFDGKSDRLGIGPRVNFTFSKVLICKSVSLTLAYQRRFAKDEKDFVRSYFLVSF